MARQEHVLSVFVASPSDVEAERDILDDVIKELNVIWSKDYCVRLETIRWETHAYPSAGVDAQEVINQQIPNDFDLFIGIMWCRLGTETSRAKSGTVEEFDRAKARYDNDPQSVQLMVYFKDEAVSPSQLDIYQLEKVKAFRNSLGDKGILYWDFDKIEQFEKLLRLHLARFIQKWKNQQSATVDELIPNDVSKRMPKDDGGATDDEGILDLIDKYEEKFSELTKITERIVAAIEDLGESITDITAELEEIQKFANGNVNRKEVKKIISKAASVMRNYSIRTKQELPLFGDTLDIGINSFIKATTISADMNTYTNNPQRLEEDIAEISELRKALATAKSSMNNFRTTIIELPRMTTELNKAKRELTSVLDELLLEFSNGDVLLMESVKVIGGVQNTTIGGTSN